MILAFDTSGPHVSVAVWDGVSCVALHDEEMAKGQAEALFAIIDATLADAGCGLEDVIKIGVGIGPGNFTGVRIAVAAARGLARALGRDAFGVTTLASVAFGTSGPVIACVSGMRGSVYAQAFGVADNAVLSSPSQIDPDDLPPNVPRIGAMFAPAAFAPAEAIARVVDAGGGVSPPTPLYLRPADAAPSRYKPPVLLP